MCFTPAANASLTIQQFYKQCGTPGGKQSKGQEKSVWSGSQWENSIRILCGKAVVFLILLWMRNTRRESGKCDTARDWCGGWIRRPADLQRQATEISGDGWWRPRDLSVTSYSLWPSAGARSHPPPVQSAQVFWTQSLTWHKTTPAQEHGGPRPPRWNLTLPATWSHRGDKYREEKEWRMGFRKWSKGHAPRQQLPAWDQATQTTTLQVKTRRPVKTTRTRFSK